jgi:DNA-binding transcriptional MocR family regulator
MDWESRLAKRMAGLAPSPIMDLIRVMAQRPAINFASGLPDPAGFPVKALREIAAQVLDEDWRAGLQYGEGAGYRPLREWVALDLTARGVPVHADQVVMTHGSQQAVDIVARTLVQRGDIVLTEQPTYLAALQVFAASEATVRPLPTDEEGLEPEAAARALRQPGVKLLYTMPSHQNPSGVTLGAPRRAPLLRAAAAAGVPVLSDEAYLHLRYEPGEPSPLAAADPEAPVITTGTFSKIIAPGLRVGWLAGPAPVMQRLGLVKEVTDLHTGSLAQRMVHRYVTQGDLAAHVAALRAAYGAKRDAFLAALESRLAGRATWTRPAGGMFLLLRLPAGQDATRLLPAALDRGVAFVPGAAFFPGGGGEGTMRLNFVSPPAGDIPLGVERLALALAESRQPSRSPEGS